MPQLCLTELREFFDEPFPDSLDVVTPLHKVDYFDQDGVAVSTMS